MSECENCKNKFACDEYLNITNTVFGVPCMNTDIQDFHQKYGSSEIKEWYKLNFNKPRSKIMRKLLFQRGSGDEIEFQHVTSGAVNITLYDINQDIETIRTISPEEKQKLIDYLQSE